MSLSPSSSSSGRVILAAIPTGTQLTFCNHLGNGRGGRTSQKEKRAKKKPCNYVEERERGTVDVRLLESSVLPLSWPLSWPWTYFRWNLRRDARALEADGWTGQKGGERAVIGTTTPTHVMTLGDRKSLSCPGRAVCVTKK